MHLRNAIAFEIAGFILACAVARNALPLDAYLALIRTGIGFAACRVRLILTLASVANVCIGAGVRKAAGIIGETFVDVAEEARTAVGVHGAGNILCKGAFAVFAKHIEFGAFRVGLA